MNKSKKGKKKPFLVVQFIELPFEGIDKYACVPNSWVIFCRTTDQFALVAYPKDEDSCYTRARVKRREAYTKDLDWRLYMASIKNQSDSYKEAEMWISRRNHYECIEGKNLDIIDSELESGLDRKLHSATQNLPPHPSTEKPQLAVKPFNNPRNSMVNVSIKQTIQSESKEEINEKLSQQHVVANSTDEILNQASMVPGCFEREKSIVIRDNKLLQSSRTENNAAVSNYERSIGLNSQFQLVTNNKSPAKLDSPNTSQSSKPSGERNHSPVLKELKQVSMPAMDMDTPTEVMNRDQLEPESVMKEKPSSSKTPLNALQQPCQPELVHKKQISLPYLYNILQEPCKQKVLLGQSKEANNNSKIIYMETTPANTANQPCQPYHQTRLPYFTASNNSYSHFQQQETYPEEANPTELTHNDQRSRPCDIISNTPSTSHHLPHSVKLSSQLIVPVSRKPSSSVIKNYRTKKTCFQNHSQNLLVASPSKNQSSLSPTHRLHPPVAHKLLHKVSRVPEMYVGNFTESNCNDNGTSFQRISNNKSAAHNLSNLARQLHCYAEQSHDQQYLHSQEDHLQRIAREQDISYLLRRSDEIQSVDQTGYFQDAMMNRPFPVHNPKPVNKPSQLLSQSHESQYQPAYLDYLQQDRRSQELLRRYTKEVNTGHRPYPRYITTNAPSAIQNYSNLSNQFHQNYELPHQRQVPQNHLNLQSNSCTRVNSNNQRPGLQGVSKRTPPLILPKKSNFARYSLAHRNYLFQDSRTQQKVSQRFFEPDNMDLAVYPQNIPVAPTPAIPNFEIQPTCSSEQSCKKQLTPVYENPRTQKRVIDQSSATNIMTKHVPLECETIRSPSTECFPEVVENSWHTDTMEGQLLPYQKVAVGHEVDINHEIISDHELISDREMFTEEAPVKIINGDESTKGIIEDTITKQQMLNEFATLVNELGATMSNTRDLFNNLRSSILESTEKYKRLLEAVKKFNALENHMNTASTYSNTTPVFLKVTKNIPNREEERENSGNGDDNLFVLPPEYDANDSKWTLKYRENAPGLVELMPESGVYVSDLQLAHCKRVSEDCKTLAGLLLTEIFSESALSVCSLTGVKTQASNNVDIKVRPGLDGFASMVLLTFVEEYGLKTGWDTSDTQGVICSLSSKIQDMRAKYV